jgi:hypothetical protein
MGTPIEHSPFNPDNIEDARRQTFAQKFMAGAELFDYACDIAKLGIRMQQPQLSEDEVGIELRRRLALSARFEEGR